MNPSHADELARDRQIVAKTHNTARYFTENRQVAWAVLLLTFAAGVFGYIRMPKAKDPVIDIRVAVATCAWPGQDAEKVEELITRRIEAKLSDATNLEKIESISRTGVSIVYVTLRDNITDRLKELGDIQARLETIHDLPAGACKQPNGQNGPVSFQKDFGDTAQLMLTIASPRVGEVELDLRAAAVAHAITTVRGTTPAAGRTALILSFPPDSEPHVLDRVATAARGFFASLSHVSDARLVQGPGFLGLDVATTLTDAQLAAQLRDFADQHLRLSELHPDVWPVVMIHDPSETRAKLSAGAADRYTYKELDTYSELLQRHLQRLPIVGRVTRTGVLPEQIYLEYSQDRLASYGLDLGQLGKLLAGRNSTATGGQIEVGGKNVTIDSSGELADTKDIGDVLVSNTSSGSPVYLRDVVSVSREYASPARYLNFITVREPDGTLATHRAITLAVNMRAGSQIAEFGAAVDQELSDTQRLLPDDLVIRRTSDQPLQVHENVELFMHSLYEAIALVVLVALIGFWEWRTALLLALSIPITLAMTFALMSVCGVDLQQISIASLIIALGLLVDDPVVASDAIKQSIAVGWKPRVAAWLGPTKLAKAILFATVTNIASYLPFLTLTGDVGKFIYSMPIVLTLSLIASRIVSMTFIPMLGKLILKPAKKPEPSVEERRTKGFGRFYYRFVGWCIDHRKLVFVLSLGFLAGGGVVAKGIKQAFFPKDLSYLSFVDVWLPEDSPLSETRARVEDARGVIAATAEQFAKDRGDPGDSVLESITSFVGGGGPRFWFSVNPELPQLNYAQLLIQVKDKHDTKDLVPLWQAALSSKVPGARIDMRQLETGKPVGIPVSIRISGDDIGKLREYANKMKAILRATPGAWGVRDDWGNDTFSVKLEVDSDRANLSGVTNLDVANSSATAMNGAVVGQLREGDREINMVARLRADERAQPSDLEGLYVSGQGGQKVPLRQVSHIDYTFQTEKIRRRNYFRTITVSCFPASGTLASEVLKHALPEITKLGDSFSPGYHYEIGGEKEEQKKSMAQMAIVALLLFLAIYLALVVQFRSAIKPVIVFAALPYGAVAAVISLVVLGAPMGFMAMLGIISLMGVIVSHIIVLFDFIEEGHERGEPMRETLLDAGLMRLRPVLVTVVATVLGLIPLARHGGPLWEPLCYAQIGGLTFATVITLVLVPVLYTIFIRDLKIIKWEKPAFARESLDFIPTAAHPERDARVSELPMVAGELPDRPTTQHIPNTPATQIYAQAYQVPAASVVVPQLSADDWEDPTIAFEPPKPAPAPAPTLQPAAPPPPQRARPVTMPPPVPREPPVPRDAFGDEDSADNHTTVDPPPRGRRMPPTQKG